MRRQDIAARGETRRKVADPRSLFPRARLPEPAAAVEPTSIGAERDLPTPGSQDLCMGPCMEVPDVDFALGVREGRNPAPIRAEREHSGVLEGAERLQGVTTAEYQGLAIVGLGNHPAIAAG